MPWNRPLFSLKKFRQAKKRNHGDAAPLLWLVAGVTLFCKLQNAPYLLCSAPCRCGQAAKAQINS